MSNHNGYPVGVLHSLGHFRGSLVACLLGSKEAQRCLVLSPTTSKVLCPASVDVQHQGVSRGQTKTCKQESLQEISIGDHACIQNLFGRVSVCEIIGYKGCTRILWICLARFHGGISGG